MNTKSNTTIHVGPSAELSLRVSVATLARVMFSDSATGETLLALERKATVLDAGVELKTQPFGGAVRILDIEAIRRITGGFRFDSKKSWRESDFRIYIRPAAWEDVRDFAMQAFQASGVTAIEKTPARELQEELQDSLGVTLQHDQYTLDPVRTIIQDEPTPTANVLAAGNDTVRLYRVYKTWILDAELCREMVRNSRLYAGEALKRKAVQNMEEGGWGWANAVQVIPWASFAEAYHSRSPTARSGPIRFRGVTLDHNVAALLDDIEIPGYQDQS